MGIAESLKPSRRGETEITDVLRAYLKEGRLEYEKLERGSAWLDTGTPESLHDASAFVGAIEKRPGLRVGSPEEIAWPLGYITAEQLERLGDELGSGGYGQYLKRLPLSPMFALLAAAAVDFGARHLRRASNQDRPVR